MTGTLGNPWLNTLPIKPQLSRLCRQITTRTILLNAALFLPNRALIPLYTCLARPTILLTRIILFPPPTSVALSTNIRPWLLHLTIAFCLKAILHLQAGPKRAGVQRQCRRLGLKLARVQALNRTKVPALVGSFLTFASSTQRARLANFRPPKPLPCVPITLVHRALMLWIKNYACT